MHLLESYACTSGLKIDKPFIYDKFFPVPTERYITLQPFSKPAKSYDYWKEVIELIKPYLDDLDIKVIQIGAKGETNIDGCVNIQGQTSIAQCAYVIKNGILHIGVDSFAAHIASGFNKKVVCLYSNSNINNVRPFWTKDENCALIEPDRKGKKPVYALNHSPKLINTISPETIAQAALDLLGISHQINQKTLYIGEAYGKKAFEWIPNCLVDTNSLKVDALICRYDLLQDIKYVKKQVEISKLCIVTDQPFELQAKKEQIKEVVFFIDKEKYKPGFSNWCRQIDNLGINLIVVSKHPENEIADIKMDFMDVAPIFYKIPAKPEELEFGQKVNYKSSRFIISNGKLYPSEQAMKLDRPVANDKQFVEGEIDESILSELEYLYVKK